MPDAYRQSVVTFLDILGFREMIRNKPASVVSAALDAVSETAAQPVGIGGDQTKVISFSDSVVRVRPTDAESPYEALLHEIQDLSAAQWSLMDFGVLVRGGTTIGEVAVAPGRAFGPAFVRAYDLESSIASAPRIVIDPTVIQHMREHIGGLSGIKSRRNCIDELKSHIRLGNDGVWFVDYISSVYRIMLPKSEVESALLRFKTIIIDMIDELPEKSLIITKFLWLIRYHNASAKRLFPANKELKIQRRDVPEADELLRPPVLVKRARPA